MKLQRGTIYLLLTVGSILTLLLLTYFVFIQQSDLSRTADRDAAVHRDAKIALDYGLTLKTDATAAKRLEVVPDVTPLKWRTETARKIEKTIAKNAALDDRAEYKDKTYKQATVLRRLSRNYLKTSLSKKTYKIDRIKLNKAGDAKIFYHVKPINMDKVQAEVQTSVMNDLESEYGDNMPDEGQMTLIQLGIMGQKWHQLIPNPLPTSNSVTRSISMTYHARGRNPYYTIDKDNFTIIMNSGLAVSQKGS